LSPFFDFENGPFNLSPRDSDREKIAEIYFSIVFQKVKEKFKLFLPQLQERAKRSLYPDGSGSFKGIRESMGKKWGKSRSRSGAEQFFPEMSALGSTAASIRARTSRADGGIPHRTTSGCTGACGVCLERVDG
jgi:hypothetical protein